MIYKLRVILETEQNVFRDIEIQASQTLLELHNGIKNAFDLEGDEMASFYLSNEDWFQGSEIPIEDLSDDQNGEVMSEIKVSDVLKKVGGRMIFVYDFLNLWTFYCEVVEIDVLSVETEYPTVVFEYGKRPNEAPDQDMFSSMDDDIDSDFDDDKDIMEDEDFYDPDNYY